MDGDLGELIRVSGGFDIAVGGFFHVGGTLGFEKSSREVVLADGTYVMVDALTVGGNNLNAFAGINGPYRTGADANGDGMPDTVNEDAMGFTLGGVDFALALLSSAPGQTAGTLANARWVALQASAAEVAVVGLDGLTLEASGIVVDINLVSGLQDGEVAAKRVVDFQRKSLGVVTGTGTTSTLTLDGAAGERVRASGSFELEVADYLQISGNMGFEKSTREQKLADGTSVTVDALTVGGSGLSAFAGVNGPYRTGPDANEDGRPDGINPDAIGFVL
jgi:hypothetical protein